MGGDGTITTVAGGGGGAAADASDGSPATSAYLGFPSAIAATGDGGFVLAHASRVSLVTAAGTIHRIAGAFGKPDFAGDGGPHSTRRSTIPRGSRSPPTATC